MSLFFITLLSFYNEEQSVPQCTMSTYFCRILIISIMIAFLIESLIQFNGKVPRLNHNSGHFNIIIL